MIFPVPISISWNAVAAMSGALAALAALLTVITTAYQWNASQTARRRERKADYANQWIVRRIHEGIDSFLEAVVPLVQKGIREINQLCKANAPITEIELIVERIFGAFEPEYFKVRRIVRVRVNGTLPPKSAEAITKALDEVQDRFTKALDTTPKKLDEERIVAELEVACSNLFRTVLKEAIDCW